MEEIAQAIPKEYSASINGTWIIPYPSLFKEICWITPANNSFVVTQKVVCWVYRMSTTSVCSFFSSLFSGRLCKGQAHPGKSLRDICCSATLSVVFLAAGHLWAHRKPPLISGCLDAALSPWEGRALIVLVLFQEHHGYFKLLLKQIRQLMEKKSVPSN